MAGRIASDVMSCLERKRGVWRGHHEVAAARPIITSSYLWPLRNVQAALHGRPRQPALEPFSDMAELAERDEFARAVEADQIAHPAEHGNVGDGIFVVHEPLPNRNMRLHHAEQAL